MLLVSLFEKLSKVELPVVNHPDYEAKIGEDNKFPIKKFGELANFLKNQKVVKKFYKPEPCSIDTVSYTHLTLPTTPYV